MFCDVLSFNDLKGWIPLELVSVLQHFYVVGWRSDEKLLARVSTSALSVPLPLKFDNFSPFRSPHTPSIIRKDR